LLLILRAGCTGMGSGCSELSGRVSKKYNNVTTLTNSHFYPIT
jgi:hypothetical protein